MRLHAIARPLWLIPLALVAANATAWAAQHTERVQPKSTYRVTPLTHDFIARSGQDLPFEFKIEALRTDVRLEAVPVGLRQEINGLILPDESVASAGKVRLLSGNRVFVRRGETATIRGRWSIPAKANGYCSAGLLLTELPSDSSSLADAAVTGKAGLNIRFITRCLLRLQAITNEGQAAADSSPVLERIGLVELGGRAVATALVRAPVGGVWQAEARVLTDHGVLGRPVALRLPVRKNLAGPAGTEMPILSGSQVLAMAPIEEPLLEGAYRLEVALKHRGTRVASREVEVRVGADDFPAQKALVARVVRDIEVTPTQLELSTAAGGNRLVPLTLTNRSDQSVEVSLSASSVGDGKEPEWLVIRPKAFRLAPRTKRRVMAAVRGGSGRTTNAYARLAVEVTPTKTTVGGRQELTVALLSDATQQNDTWRSESISWEKSAGGDSGRLLLPLVNQGERHLAPQASVTVIDELGREVHREVGYGQWLLPGERRELSCPTPKLPAGEYKVVAEVRASPQEAPRRIEQTLHVVARAATTARQ